MSDDCRRSRPRPVWGSRQGSNRPAPHFDESGAGALAHHGDHAADTGGRMTRQENRRRIADLTQSVLRHREYADLVGGPEAIFHGAQDAKTTPVSLSKYSTVSTMCSRTRGPAIWPSLVTCPTSSTACRSFCEAHQFRVHSRSCETAPGAVSIRWEYMVWMESTMSAVALRLDAVSTMASTCVSATTGRSSRRGPGAARAAPPASIAPHRSHTAPASGSQRGGGLQHQGRFADPGIATDQSHGAPPNRAEDTVEFGGAGGDSRLLGGRLGGERDRRIRAPGAARPGECGPLPTHLRYQRVPLPATGHCPAIWLRESRNSGNIDLF